MIKARTSTRKRSPSERLRTQGSKRRRAERNEIAQDQDWKCHYCKCQLWEATATIEHVIPLSRGGSNHRSNKVAACRPCNEERGRANAAAPPKGAEG